MTMKVHNGVTMKDIKNFVNEEHIKKEDIIEIFQDSDKNFVLVYFGE